MAIKYAKGNVLDAPQPIIVHQVNCQGVMGSGVAKAIKEKYYRVYEDYLDLCLDYSNSSELLGEIQWTMISDRNCIVNLFSQDQFLPRTIRHTSYDAMERGFKKIKDNLIGDIAMPKIGCGLGGGDWRIVSAIIESVFDDRDVYVYELEE